MSRFFDIDAAEATLPEVEPILAGLRDQLAELTRLRRTEVELEAAIDAPVNPGPPGESGSGGRSAPGRRAGRETARAADELRVIRLRMQGLVDQMQAAVAQIDGQGVVLRDIPTGLVDFPALVAGRQVWLCWRLGEERVGWWHEVDTGFGGRRPLEELE